MDRLPAWLLIFAVMALAGCSAGRTVLAADLPPRATVSDGKGGQLELRLADIVEGGVLVSGFGWRREHPMGGGGAPHAGIDIRAPRGAPVRAAARGTVVEIAWGYDFGRFVRIRHSPRLDTVYAHMTRVTRSLRVGDTVTPDDVIGQVGSTGKSTGPHLHFEVRRSGTPIDPLNLRPSRRMKAASPPGAAPRDVGPPARTPGALPP